MLSPTAFNIQHWRILWVKDPELRKRIREVAWDQPKVTDASVLLVMAGDLKAWAKTPKRYWRGAPEQVVETIVPAIHDYYIGKPRVERDECMRSLGLISMSIMLLAEEMGYDSCPMDGFDFEAVGRLVNLPDEFVVGLMLTIGKRSKDVWPRVGKLDLDDVLYENTF
jgi:nitroreductase